MKGKAYQKRSRHEMLCVVGRLTCDTNVFVLDINEEHVEVDPNCENRADELHCMVSA